MTCTRSMYVLCVFVFTLSMTVGCSSQNATMVFDLPPNHEVSVDVGGRTPFVLVHNRSDVPLTLQFMAKKPWAYDIYEGLIGGIGQTVSGGGTVRVLNPSSQVTQVEFDVQRIASGVTFHGPAMIREDEEESPDS